MRPGQKLPSDPNELDGPTKAAVLLLMLDKDSAGGLIRELTNEMVEDVMRVLASIESVPSDHLFVFGGQKSPRTRRPFF